MLLQALPLSMMLVANCKTGPHFELFIFNFNLDFRICHHYHFGDEPENADWILE
jgi:hypothetical protein